MRVIKQYILFFLCIFFLLGCSELFEEEDLNALPTLEEQEKITQAKWDAETYYFAAQKELDAKNHDEALIYYQAILGLFPNTPYAEQAMMNTVYAYFELKDWNQVRALAQKFKPFLDKKYHAAYVFYLSTLSFFEEFKTLFDNIFDLDYTGRNYELLLEIYDNFTLLVKQYPNTPYASEVANHILILHDALAGSEMSVARYYLENKSYIAVINRAQYLIKHFNNSLYVPDALLLNAYTYNRLNLPDLSDDYEQILRLNYPKYTPSENVLDLIVSDMAIWQEEGEVELLKDKGILYFLSLSADDLGIEEEEVEEDDVKALSASDELLAPPNAQ